MGVCSGFSALQYRRSTSRRRRNGSESPLDHVSSHLRSISNMMGSKHVDQAAHRRITNWRNTLLPDADTTSSDTPYIGSIARLYSSVCDLYRCILPKLSSDESIPTSLYRTLERGYSSLILWSYDYGVAQGKLDLALIHSREIREATISFLVRMFDVLSTRK